MYFSQLQNVFATIAKCICHNWQIYLSQLQNVFVTLAKCICHNGKMYLLIAISERDKVLPNVCVHILKSICENWTKIVQSRKRVFLHTEASLGGLVSKSENEVHLTSPHLDICTLYSANLNDLQVVCLNLAMRLRSTSPTSPHLNTCTLYSTYLNHLWFVCLNFGNASEAHLTHFLVFHLLFHLHSWIMCTLYSIFFYTCILMYTLPTFTPVFLYHVYFVFHLLYHVYLNLGMLLRSTFRSTTSTTPVTPPNQIPLLEEQCPWTMSTFFWVLLPNASIALP